MLVAEASLPYFAGRPEPKEIGGDDSRHDGLAQPPGRFDDHLVGARQRVPVEEHPGDVCVDQALDNHTHLRCRGDAHPFAVGGGSDGAGGLPDGADRPLDAVRTGDVQDAAVLTGEAGLRRVLSDCGRPDHERTSERAARGIHDPPGVVIAVGHSGNERPRESHGGRNGEVVGRGHREVGRLTAVKSSVGRLRESDRRPRSSVILHGHRRTTLLVACDRSSGGKGRPLTGTGRGQGHLFDAPGPGQWALDTGHFPRPATAFTVELFPEPARLGFAEATARFGLLLDFVEWAFVEGWGYLSPRPVEPLRSAGPQTREAWDRLVAASPELVARLTVSVSVFADRLWRDDLSLWDDELAPSLTEGHVTLQSVSPVALSDEDLLAHLELCRTNLRRAVTVHHRLNVTPVLPVGELLARCREWVAAPATVVLGLLQGTGPLAVGATEDLARLLSAIREDPEAGSTLSEGNEPAKLLASLSSRPDPVGPSLAGYVDLVGNWSAGSGFDVDEPTLLELPGLLVETIRVGVAGDRRDDHEAAADHAADLRRAVPTESRPEFDDLLAEARLVHRLRDERALYCDVWANGLMRRAILAAGDRLVGRRRLDHPSLLLEATYGEMWSLLASGAGPSPEELAERAWERQEADATSVPPVLGQPTHAPVPTAWLPPGAARTEHAFRTYLAAMAEGDDEPGSGETVRGRPASPGIYEGPARVVHGAAGIGRIREGDVLVADATSPAFNVVLPLLGAIVTDRGGILSHAAIVAREFGIPAVVGSDDATRRIPDGARVRVDGGAGEVTVLGP